MLDLVYSSFSPFISQVELSLQTQQDQIKKCSDLKVRLSLMYVFVSNKTLGFFPCKPLDSQDMEVIISNYMTL